MNVSACAARWGLPLILAVGAFLRFWGLADRGLAHYDEGHLVRCAEGPAVAARWAARSVLRGEPLTAASLKQEVRRRGIPYGYMAAKHGYGACVAAGMAVFGVRDLVPLALSAAFGVGTLVWIHRIGFALGARGPG